MATTPSGVDFQCPVCRARQPLQNQCRRCRADLSLVVKVRQRVEFLLKQRELLTDTESSKAHIVNEIRLLAPKLL